MRRVLFVTLICGAVLAVPYANAQDAAQRDEQLWAEIQRMADQSPATDEDDPAADIARRRALLDKTQLYLSLYPGGQRSEQAVRLELQTLFEIGCLTGGDLQTLAERCRAYSQPGNSPATRAEAAYWQIICRRAIREPGADTQPATTQPAATLSPFDGPMLAEYRQYVRAYPQSRYALRMNEVLFDDAQEQDDLPAMRAIVERLLRSFPGHMLTEHLEGVLRLREAVGKTFPLETLGAGGDVQAPTLSHGVGMIVVWSGQEAAIRTAREVERFRAAHPGVWVVGLNVDPDRDTFEHSKAQLKADWRQYWHELGRAGPFCRHWGVRRVPMVFVIDERGRLVGAYDRESWRAAAERALGEPSPTPSSQPHP